MGVPEHLRQVSMRESETKVIAFLALAHEIHHKDVPSNFKAMNHPQILDGHQGNLNCTQGGFQIPKHR
jgi:hypothetical protein